MHWAPIPIAEFELPPPTGANLPDRDVFRLLSRAPRRGLWLTATGFIGLLTIGLVAVFIGNTLVGVSLFVLSVAAGTGHILVRHKINAALWVTREPAAVYWAEPKQWVQQRMKTHRTVYALTLHTPAPIRLEVPLAEDEVIAVLHWLRHHNPDVLIGNFSPNDSGGRLSGNDPWSPQPTTDAAVDQIHAP
jgi:hypothetical protein